MNTQGIVSVSPMPRDNTGGGLKESLLKFRKHHSDVAIAASAPASCAMWNNTPGAAVFTAKALNNTNNSLR